MYSFTFAIVLLAATIAVLVQAQGRISRNPCLNFSCLNNGTCTSPLDFPFCQCPDGFAGDRCEKTVQTKPGRCLPISNENASCQKTCDGDFDCNGSQKCCPTFCRRVCSSNIVVDPCDGFCLNGGRCNAPADAPRCECPRGFSGRRCDVGGSQLASCPAIEPGSFGVCGGRFCETDDTCGRDERCCRSRCGGNLCTKVGFKNPPAVPILTCSNVLCIRGTICRHVVSCRTCTLKPVCIKEELVRRGIDNTCRNQNYAEVVLLQNSRNSASYSPLTCPGRSCPSGSECVRGLTGQRVCCRGILATIPRVKVGQCPKNILICGGTPCVGDVDCTGAQKCCSACGSKICSNPVNESTGGVQCGNSQCAPDEICVDKQPYCPPGRLCIQALIPTCVPRECGKCTYQESCRQTTRGYECYTPNPTNLCGGCPVGQECRPTGIECVREPCPSHECVPIG